MDHERVDPVRATRVLRLIHEITADLRDGQEDSARAKLKQNIEDTLDGLPPAIADETRDRFASALGSLIAPYDRPHQAEQTLRELGELYSSYVH